MDHELRLYAHRGSSARFPENTLAAFRAALEEGANALELDVHVTADRELVVCHDPDLVRTAGLALRIRETRLADLREITIGGETERLSLLGEVLETFPATPMSVDLKPRDPRAVGMLVDLVEAHGRPERITLASFHDPIVRAFRRRHAGPTALTHREVTLLRIAPWLARIVAGDAAQIPVTWRGIRLDTPRFIARCRRLGLRIDYWVVNDPETAARLLDRGATGVMTDEPARLAPLFAERTEAL